MTNETPGGNEPGHQSIGAGIEDRARAILGLDDLEQEPRALPIRVERMWRGENFSAHVPYTGSILFPIGHAPDLAIWRDSIAAVVQRHEALHSRLAVVHDRAVQIPDHRGVPDLDVVRVAGSDIAGYRERASASPLKDFFATPINLFEDTALRCRAFQDEDDNLTLGILMHHYFGDAWSSQILQREIETVHAALAGGMAPDLPPVAQYSDYALSQRRFLAKTLPSQLAYWHQRLGAAPPSRLPFDRQDGSNQLGRALFTIPSPVLAKLTAIARTERISLPMLCLAAFQITLARWCGQKQAVTAVTSADRIKAQFRNTIGRLMAGIPVTSVMPENISIREFLQTLAKQFYEAIAHQDLAFEQYDEIFSPPQPFCTTRFNFIPRQEGFFQGGDNAPSFSGLLQLSPVKKAMIYRDLHFLLMQYPDGLMGRVIYNLDFSAAKIEDFVEAFGQILGKIADNPGGKLGELFELPARRWKTYMSDFHARTLYVIRHGECEHNVEGRYAGQDDSPLTQNGRRQAHENGVLLKRLLEGKPAPDFIASPLHRACSTMEIIRGAAGLPAAGYRADHRLMELDLGDHSWRLIADVAKTPDHALYRRDPWNYVRPDGESHAQLHQRVGGFLGSLTRDSVLVCHAGTVRMLRAHYLNLYPDEAMNYEPPHTGITLLKNGTEQVIQE